MTKPKTLVDLEFVKTLGVVPEHDVEAIDALYPGLFDKASEAVSARFAGRAVGEGKADEVRRHVGALVAAELWTKVGTKSVENQAVVEQASQAAEQWLATSTTIKAARASAPPAPSTLAEASDPFPTPSR